MPAHINAIVVDDDAIARERLRAMLSEARDVRILEECAGGRAAVDALRRHPDANLVLLDVEMPDLDGFGVIAEVGPDRMPPAIFTTAYSQYAVRAFEAYALDYLLKPFDASRLAAALQRARDNFPARNGGAGDPRISGLMEQVGRGTLEQYPDAIAIRTGDQYVVLPLADVDWIEADGNHARIYSSKRSRIVTRTLTSLEKEVLDPETFVRVHRSAIVNTRRIASMAATHHGDLTLTLRDGTTVPCSRRQRDLLEKKIYFSA